MEKTYSQVVTEKIKEAKWYSVPSVVELIQEVENLKKIIEKIEFTKMSNY